MKRLILPLCIGLVAAIIYDSVFPQYKYFFTASDVDSRYEQGKTITTVKKTKHEISEEEYESRVKRGIFFLDHTKKKTVSLYMFLIGGAVTIGAASLFPNKKQ
jgi:hypothetical protein